MLTTIIIIISISITAANILLKFDEMVPSARAQRIRKLKLDFGMRVQAL